jgi:hypothetical protein
MTTDITRSLSRRRLLANVPAVAVAAAVPSVAIALGRLPTDDPIIEVVARHLRAWEAYEAAWLHMSKTEDEYGSEETVRIFLYEYDKTKLVPIKMTAEEHHFLWEKTGEKVPVFASNYKEIETNVTMELRSAKRKAERKAWIASKKKELKDAQTAAKRRNKTTPVGVALQAARKAGDALDNAAEDLLNTSATTVAGVAAVLEHFAVLSQHDALDRLFKDFEEDGDELRAEFMRGLAKTLRAVA